MDIDLIDNCFDSVTIEEFASKPIWSGNQYLSWQMGPGNTLCPIPAKHR